jgi:peptidoglycan/LPS O-acetylase OafA/YrhL
MREPHTGGRNNPWLDLVRSAAIVLVLLRHGQRSLEGGTGGQGQGFLQTIFLNGWVGVDLFFVLSGYLIATHLLRAGVGTGDFRLGRYLAMRALRILPAYYAVLALVAVGAVPFFSPSSDLLPLRVAYHLVLLQDYLPSDINVVFWSLGVEEKFYLLAPALIFVLLRCKAGWQRSCVLLLCFALPIVFRTATFLRLSEALDYPEFWRVFRSPFHVTLEGLVVGVGIAIAEHGGIVRQSRRAGLATLGAGTAMLVLWLASHDFMAVIDLGDAIQQPTLIAVLAGSLTLGAVQLAGTPMPLTRSSQLLSRLSYSLYLIHYPLIPLVLAITAGQGAPAFWSSYLTISLAAAVLLHVVVERPFLRIKDRLAASRQVDPPTAVETAL